jgi:hypothetical protein
VLQVANFKINGNGEVGGQFFSGGDIVGRTGLSPHSGTGDFLFFTGLPGAGINRMTINNSGNVGIGTPTPTDRLQINGDLRLGLQAGTTTTSA